MCRKDTFRLVLALALAAGTLHGQALDWRRIGPQALDLGLAGVASGRVDRVWYSPDGTRIFVRTSAGYAFVTRDLERWERVGAEPPATPPPGTPGPEPGITVQSTQRPVYAGGRHVWRSEDGGQHWENLTLLRGQSIIGEGVLDLAVSPVNPDEITVAGLFGVWRSADGGTSWSSLNANLPNLPIRRIAAVPAGSGPLSVVFSDRLTTAEWSPGRFSGWNIASINPAAADLERRRILSGQLSKTVTALAPSGDILFAGADTGELFVSRDAGRTWLLEFTPAGGGPVESIYADPEDSQFAIAVTGAERGRVLRTVNGGRVWDDLTGDLPPVPVYGITADPSSDSIYIATSLGLFHSFSTPASWVPLKVGLPEVRALDVRLDSAGNQLFAAFEGYGVYATLAPHRLRHPRVVSAADLIARAAAPGALVSVLGAGVQSASSGSAAVAVLSASPLESQIQIPFEAAGNRLPLEVIASGRRLAFDLALQRVSPAIFLDREGSPLILNADSGLMLDAATPARAGSRLQILATGLGRVTPDWPAGLAAPLENTPRVLAETKVYLDQQPVAVSRAVLAPGYIGMYLIEVEVPRIVNAGSAELYIEAGGQASNRVRLFLEP